MNKERINKLANGYDKDVLVELLRGENFEIEEVDRDDLVSGMDKYKSCNQLGQIVTSDDEKVLIAEVPVSESLSERSSRKKQFDIGKKLLAEQPTYSAVIFLFHSPEGNFRCSLIYPKFLGTRREYNSFRRYTFYVNKDHSNKTFRNQLTSADWSTLGGIKDSFSVTKVTNEFFKEYKQLFETLVEHIKSDSHFPKFAEEHGLSIEEMAKKLLGQIVFIYFLQRKKWLGAKKGASIANGDPNFLRSLFEKAKKEIENSAGEINFFNDFLEYLFYDALNNPPAKAASFYRERFDCQIPFLNGGLFEPIPDYKWSERFLEIPDEIFSNYEGTGVLDVFDSYNFTIDESSDDDQEVSDDPEMLGKVFENLIEENIRKGTGSYYTPREIVHFMVRESLKNYLTTNTKVDVNLIDKIVEHSNYEDILKQDIALEINKALKTITVVDPACGSGAFPIALLQEIARICQQMEEVCEKKPKSLYELKKEIIQNSIYGVDIDPGAVDIARLRFWLSLIVDQDIEVDDIEPLPNLDFKIMQGNSLLEDIYIGGQKIKINLESRKKVDRRTREGRLFEVGEIPGETLSLGFQDGEKVAEKLIRYHSEYFKENNPFKKVELKKEIDRLEDELIIAGHNDAALAGGLFNAS